MIHRLYKNYIYRIKKAFAVLSVAAVTAVSLPATQTFAAVIQSAETQSDNTQSAESLSAQTQSAVYDSYNYKFADLDLQVTVTDELVCFTQNVTSNNQYLELIGVSDVEELRSMMEVGNIYLEAIPRQNVNYEIIISGKELSNKNVNSLNDMSETELNTAFEQYVSESGKKTENITETVNSSEICEFNGVKYFRTDITSVSTTKVTVKVRKYYTIMQGKYITFSLQTTEKNFTDKMDKQLTDVIKSAEYKEIKSSIFDNPVFSELFSSVVTLVVPIGLLALVMFALTKAKKR